MENTVACIGKFRRNLVNSGHNILLFKHTLVQLLWVDVQANFPVFLLLGWFCDWRDETVPPFSVWLNFDADRVTAPQAKLLKDAISVCKHF